MVKDVHASRNLLQLILSFTFSLCVHVCVCACACVCACVCVCVCVRVRAQLILAYNCLSTKMAVQLFLVARLEGRDDVVETRCLGM